jgi:hypothetical protein
MAKKEGPAIEWMAITKRDARDWKTAGVVHSPLIRVAAELPSAYLSTAGVPLSSNDAQIASTKALSELTLPL